MKKIALILLLLCSPAWAQNTQSFKNFIGGLPTASGIVTGDKLYILQGGVNKSISAGAISGSGGSGFGGSTGFISVTQAPYNAKCDSVTDDTTAIQAAVNALTSTPSLGIPVANTLVIPGMCAITGTITVRNTTAATVGNVNVYCTGSGSGFIWRGANNTGPMLRLGDPAGVTLDGGVTVDGCYFYAGVSSHQPSVAIELSNDQQSIIRNGALQFVKVGITCNGTNCEFTRIDHNSFTCDSDCIQMNSANAGANSATVIQNNNFLKCGNYCYNGTTDAAVTLISNYFEGNTAGAKGSVFISGFGDRLIGNFYEDQGAAGVNFRSITFGTATQFIVMGDYFVGGGSPFDYLIDIGTTGVSQGEFHGLSGNFNTNSGFYINAMQSQVSTWFGGSNCSPTAIWGGSQGFRMITEAGCETLYSQGAVLNYVISTTGLIQAIGSVSSGPSPALTGSCPAAVTNGGATAGRFNMVGACSGGTIILGLSDTAPNGWSCTENDLTDPTASFKQTATATTNVTLTITTTGPADSVNWLCIGY